MRGEALEEAGADVRRSNFYHFKSTSAALMLLLRFLLPHSLLAAMPMWWALVVLFNLSMESVYQAALLMTLFESFIPFKAVGNFLRLYHSQLSPPVQD
jgi:hypothetical protein